MWWIYFLSQNLVWGALPRSRRLAAKLFISQPARLYLRLLVRLQLRYSNMKMRELMLSASHRALRPPNAEKSKPLVYQRRFWRCWGTLWLSWHDICGTRSRWPAHFDIRQRRNKAKITFEGASKCSGTKQHMNNSGKKKEILLTLAQDGQTRAGRRTIEEAHVEQLILC